MQKADLQIMVSVGAWSVVDWSCRWISLLGHCFTRRCYVCFPYLLSEVGWGGKAPRQSN